MNIELRYQQVSDAERFYEILSNSTFKNFGVQPENIEAEIEYLKTNDERLKRGEHNYTICHNNIIVGGCGIKLNQHYKHIAALGYFVDTNYQGKGIATKAVELMENIAFNEFGVIRFELRISEFNIASQRVADKCGFVREGFLKKGIKVTDGFRDVYLYAKIKK